MSDNFITIKIAEVDEKVKNHVFSDASGQTGKLYEQQPIRITGSSSNTMSFLDYPILILSILTSIG